MSDFDIRTINLNLLPALEALLETRSVSAAARRAHVTQSAMSHSLAKLRAVLGDPLLVPSGRTLVPSPRAARIAAALPAAIDQLGETLAPSQPFDPRTTRRTFRLATLDYFEIAILGDFMASLRTQAPHASVWIERLAPGSLPALVQGEIDAALVGESSIPRHAALARHELFRDPFVVMMRADHPAAKRRTLSLETYLRHPHVVVTVEGRADGAVDRALEAHGARRTVALRLPHFATAPLAVLGSDALCTIASSIAERARDLYGLTLRTPPIPLGAPGIALVWSKRLEDDAGARWLRSLFTSGDAASPHVRALMRDAKRRSARSSLRGG